VSDHPFPAVSILLADRGARIRNVTSTREAAELLLTRWPVDGGQKHLAARKACLAVLQGQREAIEARKAFAAAAEEAGILVGSGAPPAPRARTPR
jgi:hypothetical protein